MCGIYGFTWKNYYDILKMKNSLFHRGVDEQHFYENEFCSLGWNRLKIQDRGNYDKILRNENEDMILTFNGEIYNYKDLKNELSSLGHVFRTQNDGEVVVHGFEEWGESFFSRLDGMFAFAIFDVNKKHLFLARDPLGIKNIYYYKKQGSLIFSSEIKGILTIINQKIPLDINVIKIINTFGFYPGVKVPFSNVLSLQPGELLKFNCVTHKLDKYIFHSIYYNQDKIVKSPDYELLEALLTEAIKKRVNTDLPIAILLSGGLDSSFVTMVASKFNKNIKAFSVGFCGERNDFEVSKQLANKLGIEYEEILIHTQDIYDDLHHICYSQEIPQDGGSLVPKWFLAKKIHSQGYKIGLGGSGADETFAGYSRHQFRYQQFEDGSIDNVDSYLLSGLMKGNRNLLDFDTLALWNEISSKKPSNVDISTYYDVSYELPYYHNVRVDKVFMSFGIEYRVPFEDFSLVNYVSRIPFNLRFTEDGNKILLRKISEKVLDNNIAYAKKKALRSGWFENNKEKWNSLLYNEWFELFKEYFL